MSMETIKAECQAELALVENADQLSAFWAKYLGKTGEIQKLMGGIKNVPKEEKKNLLEKIESEIVNINLKEDVSEKRFPTP